MAEIKNMLETANQKILEGLMEAGLTEHEERMLDKVIMEDMALQKKQIALVFFRGLLLGFVIAILVMLVGLSV